MLFSIGIGTYYELSIRTILAYDFISARVYDFGPGANLLFVSFSEVDEAAAASAAGASPPDESESDITIGIGCDPISGVDSRTAFDDSLFLIFSRILCAITPIVGLVFGGAAVFGSISLAHIFFHFVSTFLQYFLAADGDRAHSC